MSNKPKYNDVRMFMGTRVPENAIEIALAGAENGNQNVAQQISLNVIPTPAIAVDTPENYVILSAGRYGNHDYPDLLIGMNRLSYDSEVEKAAQSLGLTLQNNQQGFIGDINWENAIKLNQALGNFTLPLILGKEFIKLLRDGANGKKVYNGKGDQISSSQLGNLYNEIVEVRDPWRAEWYDTKFTSKQTSGGFLRSGKTEWFVDYPIFENGTLKRISESLEQCLRQDKNPGIDIDSWLNQATSQGLPHENSASGSLYYWHPRNDKVAGFGAGSGGAGLVCCWGPTFSSASLGVRAVRVKS